MITVGIDVKQCVPIHLDTSLRIDAIAGAQESYWRISGSALYSPFTTRAITVSVDENDVISSVNATATDKRTAILGDIIKIAAIIAPVVLIHGPAPPVKHLACTSETVSKVQRAKDLEGKLASLLAQSANAPNSVTIQQEIDAVAAMLASARAEVHVEVTAKVQPEKVPSSGEYTLDLDRDALSKVFTPVDDETVKDLKVVASIERVSPTKVPTAKAGAGQNACDQSIPLPDAQPIKLIVKPKGTAFINPSDVSQTQTLYVSQLSDPVPLCISAGFGENRTVSLTLDKFGRVTQFTWNSDATVANVSSAFAGASSDIATLLTLDPAALRTKAELDRVSNENQLIQALQCSAKLKAGGSC